MIALLLVDALFARSESAMLLRLQVGMADEGIRVLIAVPEEAADSIAEGSPSEVLRYTPPNTVIARFLQRRSLEAQIAAHVGPAVPDVVHVFGGRAWSLGFELAERAGSPLAVEVWRSGLADRVRSLVSHLRGRARQTNESPNKLIVFVAEESIAAELRETVAGVDVRLAAWGVHAPTEANAVLPEKRAPAAALAGSGRGAGLFVAAYEGAADALRDVDGAFIMVDSAAADRSGLWRLARSKGAVERTTIMDGLEQRRELVLRADMLLYAEASGDRRTLLLDAMAHGMVVLAAAGSAPRELLTPETAVLVKDAEAASWRDAVRGVLANPERARSIGLAARELVRAKRRASTQVAAILDAYEGAVAAPIPMGGQGSGWNLGPDDEQTDPERPG